MIRNSKAARQQQGFTMMQMVITISIIAIVSTVGVLGINTARAEFRLQSSARLFSTYVEKARADSIRRPPNPRASSTSANRIERSSPTLIIGVRTVATPRAPLGR